MLGCSSKELFQHDVGSLVEVRIYRVKVSTFIVFFNKNKFCFSTTQTGYLQIDMFSIVFIIKVQSYNW